MKRYDYGYQCDGESGRCRERMVPTEDGDYVFYTDHRARRAEGGAVSVKRLTPNKIANLVMADDAWHDSEYVAAADYIDAARGGEG